MWRRWAIIFSPLTNNYSYSLILYSYSLCAFIKIVYDSLPSLCWFFLCDFLPTFVNFNYTVLVGFSWFSPILLLLTLDDERFMSLFFVFSGSNLLLFAIFVYPFYWFYTIFVHTILSGISQLSPMIFAWFFNFRLEQSLALFVMLNLFHLVFSFLGYPL